MKNSRKNWIKSMTVFMLAAALMVIWQIPSLAASGKGVSAEIGVSQNFEIKNGKKPAAGAEFKYELVALKEGNPMPEGTDETGIYHFILDGKDGINIQVNYTQAGFYQYEIKPAISEELTGYTYDKSIYVANVHVKNFSHGLDTTVVITNAENNKVDNITYMNAYEAEDKGFVKTGDNARPVIYTIICCLCICIFFFALKRRKDDIEEIE